VILYNSPPLQISVIPPMTLKEKVLANNMVNIFIFFILRIISNYIHVFFA
jgi:cell division protein FtsL